MFRDKMYKTTVAPSDGLWTTLNSVVYIVIYAILLTEFDRRNSALIFSYSSLLLCIWVSKFVTPECCVFFRLTNDANRFIFVDVNKTHLPR